MSQTLVIVVDFILRIAALLFLMRFLLQASGADFYNPISQAVTKATDPICKPIRGAIKPIGNFDVASVLIAWLISLASIYAFTYIQYGSGPELLPALWAGLIKNLLILLQFYKWTIIIIVIASFVAQGSYHPALQLLNQLIEPVMSPVRKALPSLGPLDLSPMLVLLLIIVAEDILMRSF